jgi:hypothetical protein
MSSGAVRCAVSRRSLRVRRGRSRARGARELEAAKQTSSGASVISGTCHNRTHASQQESYCAKSANVSPRLQATNPSLPRENCCFDEQCRTASRCGNSAVRAA